MQADSLPGEPEGKPKNTEVGSLSFLQEDLSEPGIKQGSPALQADSLPTELSVKPKFFGRHVNYETVLALKSLVFIVILA